LFIIVVKLFNAIRTQQKVTEVAVEQAASSKGTQIAKEKAKNGKKSMVYVVGHYTYLVT
jgi:hypothetical protein